MLFDTDTENKTLPELVVSFVHSSPLEDHEHEGIHSAEYTQPTDQDAEGNIHFDVAGDVYTYSDVEVFIEYFVGIVSENIAQTAELADSSGTEIFFRFIPDTEYPLLCILSDQNSRVQQIELSTEDIHELSYLFLRLVVAA